MQCGEGFRCETSIYKHVSRSCVIHQDKNFINVILYHCRTLNPSLGIMKFESDSDAIGMPVFADSLQVSPAGQRATVVVVSLNRRFLYVSRNYAKNFDQYQTPTVDFDPTEELYLSSFNPQHMVVRSRTGEVC